MLGLQEEFINRRSEEKLHSAQSIWRRNEADAFQMSVPTTVLGMRTLAMMTCSPFP